jgi:hypothetical protein
MGKSRALTTTALGLPHNRHSFHFGGSLSLQLGTIERSWRAQVGDVKHCHPLLYLVLELADEGFVPAYP